MTKEDISWEKLATLEDAELTALDRFEISALKRLCEIARENNWSTPGNKRASHNLNVTRNALKKARHRLAHKLNLPKGV